MDWRQASFLVLALWGSYMIFGSKATEIHGEKVSMAFEAAGMMLVGLIGVMGATGDFTRVTFRSFCFASVMGMMSGAGLYIQLYALRIAPQQLPIIAMITGMWPVVTVLLAVVFVGSRLAPHQWLGVGLATAGMILVNWTK